MNIDIHKFAELFQIHVKTLQNWFADAPILNIARKSLKNKPFIAQLRKIKQLIINYNRGKGSIKVILDLLLQNC